MSNKRHYTDAQVNPHKPSTALMQTHFIDALSSIRRHSKPVLAAALAASMFLVPQHKPTHTYKSETNVNISQSVLYAHKPTTIESFANVKKATLNFDSSNWAAYYVASNLKDPKHVVSSVVGSWIVPKVKIGCYPKGTNPNYKIFSGSQWIGIGGVYDSSLIQLGTDTEIFNGKEQSYGWAEILPQSLVVIPGFKVSPGDEITAEITKVKSIPTKNDPNLGLWRISLNNLTEKIFAHTDIKYSSSQTSAEWVVERPVDNMLGYNVMVDLPSFKSVKFVYNGPTTGNYATLNGVTGPINSFPNAKLEMVNYENLGSTVIGKGGGTIMVIKAERVIPVAVPSKLSNYGMSFSVKGEECPAI